MAPFSLTAHLAAIVGADPFALPQEAQKLQQVLSGNPRFALGWQPKNDCMFVMPLIEASRSKGGLVIPDEHRERPQKGIVLAVGPGLWDAEQQKLYPVEAEPGDLVTYGKYAGETFEISDDTGATVAVFIMKNVEIKARRPKGSYPDLVEHRVGEGTADDRHVYHESHLKCDHCPTEKSVLVEEERARLQAQHKADLHGEVK